MHSSKGVGRKLRAREHVDAKIIAAGVFRAATDCYLRSTLVVVPATRVFYCWPFDIPSRARDQAAPDRESRCDAETGFPSWFLQRDRMWNGVLDLPFL